MASLISKIMGNAATHGVNPISSFSYTISSPVGLSLILAEDEHKNIVFSPYLKSNILHISASSEIESIPENEDEETTEMEQTPSPSSPPPPPPPMMMTGTSFSGEDMMLSEYYTCIRVFNGPNPRVTHLFGDLILKNNRFECVPPTGIDPHQTNLTSALFLKDCFLCKKELKDDEDIYFYRDMSFCSQECRLQEMWLHYREQKMKQAKKAMERTSSDSGASSSGPKVIFFIGDE